MRKLFSVILLCSVFGLLLTSCSESEEETYTEYQVFIGGDYLFMTNVSQITVIEYNNNGIEVANHIIKCENATISKKYVAKPEATMVKAFARGRQVGQTLFLELGGFNVLSISHDDAW